MSDEEKIPKLMEFLFGQTAEVAQRGASPRLLSWSQAFEEWLADRKENYRKGAYKQAAMSWRRLLQERGKMPWELRQEDFEGHAAWMEEEGYAATTIANALGYMTSFYRWCEERQIDPECERGFNPAAGAARPKVRRWAGAKLLSREEVERLLGILRRDSSALGKRDYAFFLARLRLGVPLGELQKLRWGQLSVTGDQLPVTSDQLPVGSDQLAVSSEEGGGGGRWVRWRERGGRVRLEGEVWEAIEEWLRASGRRMREGSFIFTPMVGTFPERTGEKAEDWAEGRYLTSGQILANLKLYGRRVGIEEGKLTLMALRNTATRLRLEEGASEEEMQVFLDSREEAKYTKSRLRRLPKLEEGEAVRRIGLG